MLRAVMAYREASSAAGLPFPRKRLGVFTATAVVVATSVFLGPAAMCFRPPSFTLMKNGGAGTYVLLVLALVVAVALAVIGASVVRGKRTAIALVAALPGVPVIVATLLFWREMARSCSAVTTLGVAPALAARIFAEGTSEADSLLILGSAIGACAFGAAATALLGAAGSIDRTRSDAPAGRAFVVFLVLGAVGIVASVGVRVVLRSMLGWLPFTIPSLLMLTVLACFSARNASLVRTWHDAEEANRWLAATLAAAVCAATALVLADLGAWFARESAILGAISSESVDAAQKARLLTELLRERHAAHVCTCVDGAVAFAVVAVASLPAIRRAPDERTRYLRGSALLVALGGTALVALVLLAARGSVFAAFGASSDTIEARARLGPVEELPQVAADRTFREGDVGGVMLLVTADGNVERVDAPLSSSRNVIVVADRRARWGSVVPAIRSAFHDRRPPTEVTSNHDLDGPTLSIRIAGGTPPAPPGFGPYRVFVGSSSRSVGLVVTDWIPFDGSMRRGEERHMRRDDEIVKPRPTDDIDAVVAQIVEAQRGQIGPLYGNKEIQPPEGQW